MDSDHWMGFIVLIGLYCVSTKDGVMTQCVRPGFRCTDCQSMVFCVGQGVNNKISEVPLYQCDNSKGQYCSVQNGGCIADKNACNTFGADKLECSAKGVFPDPYDCSAYHICQSGGNNGSYSEKKLCSQGKAYNSLSKTCDLSQNHRVCIEGPVPRCSYPLQYGATLENGNIYYVCLDKKGKLEPRLYKCEDGFKFDQSQASCILDNEYTSPFAPKSSQPSTSVRTAAPASQPSLPKCKKAGRIADSADCRKFFICSPYLVASHAVCNPGTYFSTLFENCVPGTC